MYIIVLSLLIRLFPYYVHSLINLILGKTFDRCKRIIDILCILIRIIFFCAKIWHSFINQSFSTPSRSMRLCNVSKSVWRLQFLGFYDHFFSYHIFSIDSDCESNFSFISCFKMASVGIFYFSDPNSFVFSSMHANLFSRLLWYSSNNCSWSVTYCSHLKIQNAFYKFRLPPFRLRKAESLG